MTKLCYEQENEEALYFDLPNSEGLRIKGILRGKLTQPVAVIMHGKPGHGNELLPYLGARYLHEQGVASLRLFMYDFEPKTRNLLDCTLQTHADDFDAVVAALRKQDVPKIFGIGHSYGGITILLAKAKLDAAVLWDPTHGSVYARHPEQQEDFPTKTIDGIVVGLAGYGYIDSVRGDAYSKQMGDTTEWAAHKGYPLKVISASEGIMTDLGARYIDAADEPKELVVIKGASHQFEDSDRVVAELFDETTGWLQKFI
jgi:dienelactone hydrolase